MLTTDVRTSNQLNFGEVCNQIVSDRSLPEWRRRNVAYFQRRLDKLEEFDFSAMPATRESLSIICSPSVIWPDSLKNVMWEKAKGYVRFMLRYSGTDVPRPKPNDKLPEWKELLSRIETRTTRFYMGAFAQACSLKGIRPQDVNVRVMDEYEAEFIERSAAISPRKYTRDVRSHWNRAVQIVPGWPGSPIELPKARGPWVLPCSEFPTSFKEDFDSWLAWVAEPDLLDPNRPEKPLSAASVTNLRQCVRRLASALALSRYDRKDVINLASLTVPSASEVALAYIARRDNSDNSAKVYGYACILRRIARAWVGASPETLKAHDSFCERYRRPDGYLSKRNKDGLRQFNDRNNLRKLLEFPQKQLDRARRQPKPTNHRAIAVQIGLAVELLWAAPVPLKNLASTHLDHHLTRNGKSVTLNYPPQECRTRLGLNFELPERTIDYLDAYITEFRPVLACQENRWLFPGAGNKHKCERWLSTQISQHIKRNTDLYGSAKLIRHLVAKLYLDAHPDGYEVVRQMLGHWRIGTTYKLYNDADLKRSIQLFDRQLGNQR